MSWYYYVLIGLALVVLAWLFFRKRLGRWGQWIPSPEIPSRAPSITHEEAEAAREAITEELTAGEKKAETEAEELKRKVREKFGPLSILLVVGFAAWGVACTHTPKKVLDPAYIPTKAPTEALIDSCDNLPETLEVKCPLRIFINGIDNFADLWEYSTKCGHRLTACQKFGAVDKAEMQGKINQEAARADMNARWIWYTLGGGLIVSVAAFFVGALAF